MDEQTELEKENIRKRLIELRQQLQAVDEAGREAAGTVELDQTRVGRLSRMDAMQAQAMSQETNRRRCEELQRISAALRRLDDGEFGYCLQCDEPIARARLEANPTATLCIDCANRAESG